MNEITEISVYNAAQEHRAIAKRAAEGDEHWRQRFDNYVREEWWTQVIGSDGVYLRHRALQLVELRYEGTIDPDGYPYDEYWDFACLTPMIERALERRIKNHPELQLTEYDDYLLQLFPTQLKMEI